MLEFKETDKGIDIIKYFEVIGHISLGKLDIGKTRLDEDDAYQIADQLDEINEEIK